MKSSAVSWLLALETPTDLEEAWREPANGELPPRQSPRPNPRRYPPPRPNPVVPTGHLDFIIAKIQVTGDRRHDCGLTVAAIERVRLDHEHREIGPPNLSPLNFVHLYHESFSMDLSWARCSPPSTLPGRREYTSFRRSVTACCCCRFRYSASAVAYNLLLETRRRRAAASAWRKGRRVPKLTSSCAQNNPAAVTYVPTSPPIEIKRQTPRVPPNTRRPCSARSGLSGLPSSSPKSSQTVNGLHGFLNTMKIHDSLALIVQGNPSIPMPSPASPSGIPGTPTHAAVPSPATV